MGVREYIGRRYAPIFGRRGESSTEWDNTAPYEELTIVTYHGDSYTSRRPVPSGIAITNTDYWVLTGLFNAQVEAYRAEVSYYDKRITDNENNIAALLLKDDEFQASLDALIAQVETQGNRISELANLINYATRIANEAKSAANRVIEIAKGGTGATNEQMARKNLGLAGNDTGNVIIVKEAITQSQTLYPDVATQITVPLSAPEGYVLGFVGNVRSTGAYVNAYVDTAMNLYAGKQNYTVRLSYDYEDFPEIVQCTFGITYVCVPAGSFLAHFEQNV